MTLVSLSQIIHDVKPEFLALVNKLGLLRQKYIDYYGKEDIRPEFFDSQFQLNLWLLIEFDNFLKVANHSNGRVTRYVQLTPQDWTQFLAQYDTINRTCYCTKAMFDVDNFLASIAEKINVKTSGGYTNTAKRLSNELSLTEQECKILLAPAALRNSLHNNGYHRNDDLELELRGVRLEFKKGYQISVSGWHNMYIMFDELFTVLDTIINSHRVKSEPNIAHNSMTYHDTQ